MMLCCRIENSTYAVCPSIFFVFVATECISYLSFYTKIKNFKVVCRYMMGGMEL